MGPTLRHLSDLPHETELPLDQHLPVYFPVCLDGEGERRYNDILCRRPSLKDLITKLTLPTFPPLRTTHSVFSRQPCFSPRFCFYRLFPMPILPFFLLSHASRTERRVPRGDKREHFVVVFIV